MNGHLSTLRGATSLRLDPFSSASTTDAEDAPVETLADGVAPQAFQSIARLLVLAASASMAAFCPWDDDQLSEVHSWGARPLDRDLMLLLAYRTMMMNGPLFITEVELSRTDSDAAGQSMSFVGQCVRSEDNEPHGVLCMLLPTRDVDGERCREAMAAARAMVVRDVALRDQAAHDYLTGLNNRRSVDATLAGEWRRAIREQTSLSVLLLDVDHFKRFNDDYGHLAGDQALRAVAKALAATLRRPGDSVGRFGGEEFVACLPHTDRTGAMTAAEAVRSAVERLGIRHGSTPAGRVTVSVGVASVPAADLKRMQPRDLVKLADAAMYRAKELGRNRVALSPRAELILVRDATHKPESHGSIDSPESASAT